MRRPSARLLAILGWVAVATVLSTAGGSAAAGPQEHAAAPGVGRALRPVEGPVVRWFDPPAARYGAGHRGVDLAAAPGERVRAALGGRISFAGDVAGRGWVTVDHGGGLDTTYGILDLRRVTRGDRVRAGEVLGWLAAEAEHLDWGARLQGDYLDPLALLGPWRARLVPLGR